MDSIKRTLSSLQNQLHSWWQATLDWLNDTSEQQPTIFRSARLKLTGFYLAVLLAFCLTLTTSVRVLAVHAYDNAGFDERGIVRRLMFDQYSVPPQSPTMFNQYQSHQDDTVHRRLNEDLVIVNVAALLLGGWLSYWYAGRTLRPIEEAHENQARFASDASHELRTPLANLRVENEVFLRQKDFTKTEAKELIESNLEEVQRLESLASNLLALTQYGRATLHLSSVSVSAITEAATNQMDKLAKARQVIIHTDVQDSTVLGNFDSLVQLVAIVLDNALKYGPNKSNVYVQGSKQSSSYTLSVHDEGPGIAPHDLSHIFDRLYRGDKARSSKVGGYGLGLSLAQEIIRANHGSIEAINYPGGGAMFTITLNLASH